MFPRRPSNNEWESFDHNSHKVRRLTVPSIWSPQHIGAEPMKIIQRTAPRLTIFRNLTTLITSLTSLDPILMSESVQDLTIEVDMVPNPHSIAALDGLVELIIVRMPKIHTLTLLDVKTSSGPHCYAGFGQQFARLMAGLPELEKISRPAEVFTPLLFRTLSGLPNLRRVHTHIGGREIQGDIQNLQALESLPLVIPETSFPKLESIHISVLSVSGITRILQHPSFPLASLVELWLYLVLLPETSVDRVGSLIDSLAYCKQLKTLVIQYSRRPVDGIGSGPTNTQDILLKAFGYDHIRRFLDIFCLTTFALDHPLPISISPEQCSAIARRSGRFQCLWLSPVPSERGSDPLPLSVLRDFAEHCPNLQRLGIYVRPTEPMDFGPIKHSRFRCLEQLFVGSSPLPSAYYTPFEDAYRFWKVTGQVLATLLPLRCSIVTLFDIYDMDDGDLFRRLTSEAQWDIFVGIDGWRVVKGLVSVFGTELQMNNAVVERLMEELRVTERSIIYRDSCASGDSVS